MRITPTSGLSPDEIERLIAEAETSAEADRRVKEIIGLRNRLESLVRNTQRAYNEMGSMLSADDRREGQRVLAEGAGAVQSDDPEEIRRVLQSVEHLANKITEAVMNPRSSDDSGTEDEIERF